MALVEKFVAGAFGLIVLYLIFNAQNFDQVIGGIASNSAGVFGTLQGRPVDFGTGVRIT